MEKKSLDKPPRIEVSFENALSRVQEMGSYAFLSGDLDLAAKVLEAWKHLEGAKSAISEVHARLDLQERDLGHLAEKPFRSIQKDKIDAVSTTIEKAQPTPTEPLAVDLTKKDEGKTTPEKEKKSSTPIALPLPVSIEPKKVEKSLPILPGKKHALGETTLRKLRLDFIKRSIELYGTGRAMPDKMTEIKAAVCLGRGIHGEITDASHKKEIEFLASQLMKLWRKTWPKEEFFGFNLFLDPPANSWIQLSEIYDQFAIAEQTIDWLETHPDIRPETQKELLLLCAACGAYLYRFLADKSVGINSTDFRQMDFKDRIEILVDKNFDVQYWRLNERVVPMKTVRADMQSIAGKLAHARNDEKKRTARKSALEKLTSYIEGSSDDHFDTELINRVTEVLESGVPASDKTLVKLVSPYAAIIFQQEFKPSHKLFGLAKAIIEEQKRQEKALHGPNKIDELEESVDLNPMTETHRLELIKLLRGKKVLFIGGNKRQEERRKNIESGLKLASLEWPDMEESTNMNTVLHKVEDADVVVLLIRFARHHYSQFIDEGKRLGKMTVRVQAGLGQNRIYHDMYDQLIARQLQSPESAAS